MVTLCINCKNAALLPHVVCPGTEGLILAVVTIFDNIYDGESHGIPQIPIGIIPRGSRIQTISIGIPCKKVGISMEFETKMAEAPANCFPSKFCGSLTFCLESAGIHGGR